MEELRGSVAVISGGARGWSSDSVEKAQALVLTPDQIADEVLAGSARIASGS